MKEMKNTIPIKIDVVQKRDSAFSSNQMFFIFLFGGLGLFCFIFGLAKTVAYEDITFKVMGALFTLIGTLTCLRMLLKYGLNEKKLYSRYLREKDGISFTLRDLWDILFIEDTGKIIYKNGKSAYLIKMDRTSIIGKSPNFSDTNYNSMTAFIRSLSNKEYIVRKYKLVVSDANIEKFEWLEQRLKKIKNNNLRNMAGAIVKHNKSKTAGSNNRSIEYWLVYARVPNKFDYEDLTAMLKLTASTIYKPKIENSKGVYEFLYRYYKLDYLDIKSALFSNLSPDKVAIVDKNSLIKADQVNPDLFAPLDGKAEKLAFKFEQMKKRLKDNE